MDGRRMSKGEETRMRILDAAEVSVLAKGFAATSIDELIAETRLTKSGFFYHFKDKNDLAKALLRRHIAQDEAIFARIIAQARAVVDDPLQVLLASLRILADILADMPNGHPGCLVATACYSERMFDKEVRALNAEAVALWRRRFRAIFEEIVLIYRPREQVDVDDLADMVSSVLEGGIVMAKALGDPRATERQILLLRLLFKRFFVLREVN